MLFILVIGLIIVALMVYTSTRLKRVSAEAFDAETIETAEFTIQKPAGWLSIAEPKPGYAFEAYTKEFGASPNEDIRLGTANVTVSNSSLDDAIADASDGATPQDDLREVVGGIHYRVLQLEREEKNATFCAWVKLAEKDGKAYTFTIKALDETTDEFRRDIEGMIDRFELK